MPRTCLGRTSRPVSPETPPRSRLDVRDRTSAGAALALLALLAPACHGPAERAEAADIASSNATVPAAEDDRREAAVERIRSGDYEGARDILDALLVDDYLARARTLLDSGAPEDALVRLDEVLRLTPRDLETRLLKAEGSLALAEKGMAEGGSVGLIEGSLQDALAYFLDAGASARSYLGASRAAYLLGRNDEALGYARRGVAQLDDEPGVAEGLAPPPHRTLSEAAFSAYVGARQEEEPEPATVEALFRETEEALAHLAGRATDDPWVWTRLSDLYEWEERYADARASCLDGLGRFPTDGALLERLARVTRASGGAPAVIETFESFVETNPSVALGHWYLGVDRFDDALERLSDGPKEDFDEAEATFVTCRELDPAMTEACLGYEVMCRNARGWIAFNAGDLEEAKREFLSMNELFDRGIEWSIDGKLYDGIRGLTFIGDKYNELEDWNAAGEAFWLAHEFQPEHPTWPNNAGFFFRDAGVSLEDEGLELCRAAHGELEPIRMTELREEHGIAPALAGSEEEARLFETLAERKFEVAREAMEKSWTAYEAAAELQPEDARVVNDTGLILVYYLHRDLDRAEQLLHRAIELAEAQLPAVRARVDELRLAHEKEPTAESEAALVEAEDELFNLTEAWGDAHENLGVLEHVHRGNIEKAIAYFEKAVEIGPEPRPLLENDLIPILKGEREPEDTWFEHDEWGKPCAMR